MAPQVMMRASMGPAASVTTSTTVPSASVPKGERDRVQAMVRAPLQPDWFSTVVGRASRGMAVTGPAAGANWFMAEGEKP